MAWTDLGVQPIAESFRVSVSSKQFLAVNAAIATVMVLLVAELGVAWGRARKAYHRERRRPMARGRPHAELVREFPLLEDDASLKAWNDLAGHRALAAHFGIADDTFERGDKAPRTDELQRVIDALLGKGSYAPHPGQHSFAIDVDIDGFGRAEAAWRSGDSPRWGIALSPDFDPDMRLRPGVALMIAALKSEYVAFDEVL